MDDKSAQDNVDDMIEKMIEEGHLQNNGTDDSGETVYKLTEQGAAHAVNKIMGGQDVANTTQAFLRIAGGTDLDPKDPGYLHLVEMMLNLAQIIQGLLKDQYPEAWQHLVERLETDVLEPTGWFNDRGARAFPIDWKEE